MLQVQSEEEVKVKALALASAALTQNFVSAGVPSAVPACDG